MRALIQEMVEQYDQPTIVDMEAGLEHLSRGTIRYVDCILIIIEPYFKSMETGAQLNRLAKELEIKHVYCIANKVRGTEDERALETFCAENDYDCILVPGGNPPRSALAYSVIQLLHIFAELGFVSHEHKTSMLRGGELILKEKENIHNLAKEMASHLFNKVGVYYAETKYEGVIVRARQQFNENSKYLGWHHVIPEMNHNELVGWSGGDERFAPIFFNTGDIHPRNYKRFEITQNAVEKKCGKVLLVNAKGDSFIERSVYLINIVDWASYYLCEMNGADIIDIEIIDYLKGELAKY